MGRFTGKVCKEGLQGLECESGYGMTGEVERRGLPPPVCLFWGDPILGILSPPESMTSWSSHLGIYKPGIERMQKVVGILKRMGEAHR